MMALFCGNFACSAHTRVNITPKVPSSHFGTLAILYSDSRILAILTSCRMIWRHGKLILEGNGRFYLNSSNKLNQQSAHQEGPSQQGYPQPSFRFHSNILSTRQQVVTSCVLCILFSRMPLGICFVLCVVQTHKNTAGCHFGVFLFWQEGGKSDLLPDFSFSVAWTRTKQTNKQTN